MTLVNQVDQGIKFARDLIRREPLLGSVGLMLLILALPTFGASFFDTVPFNGVNRWYKPTKFLGSVGLFFVTLAFYAPYVRSGFRQGVGFRVLNAVIIFSGVFEVVYITWRAARGEGSHYNTTTPLNAILYRIMGVGAVLMVVGGFIYGLSILRSDEGGVGPSLRTAIGWGLLLGAVLGGVIGGHMSAQPGHLVGGSPNDSSGIPFLGWSRTGGDLRIAHFVGLHAIHIIPLGVLFLNRANRSVRPASVVWSAAIYAAVTIFLFVLGIRGQTLFSSAASVANAAIMPRKTAPAPVAVRLLSTSTERFPLQHVLILVEH